MVLRKAFLIVITACISLFSSAQEFGGFAPSIKWRQINTDTVRVIFPANLGLEKQAIDIAATIHRLGLLTHNTIGDRVRKVSIVLQPNTTISNGYVGLGPWRSEFQLTPSQNSFDLGSIPWHHFLALHEFRHVQQYSNFNKGVSKAFSYLFGQDGLSLASGAAVPNWFWEGDAVYQETLMSGQGRGRLPFFYNEYRSLWVAKKEYSWMKLRNGSLRDLVPDHYRLGFMMVAYGREKYGDDFWKKVTDDAVRYKGLFYPFQKAIKKYSGKDYVQFRKDAIEQFKKESPINKDEVSQYALKRRNFVGDEEFPQWMGGDSVILMKSSFNKIPAFYTRNLLTHEERKIRVRDIALDNYFSANNGKLVYAAYQPHVRWNWKNYSVLKVMDIATGEEKTISRNSNYFAPDISADGQQVVAVKVYPGKPAALHVLSVDGSLVAEVPNPAEVFYSHPKFYDNTTIAAAIRNRVGAMTIGLVNTKSGEIEELLPWSMHVTGFLSVKGDTITFTASHGSRDELYALVNKQLYKLNIDKVNEGTGNYQWSMRNNKAVWSAFTAVGFRLQQQENATALWEPVNKDQFASAYNAYAINELKTTTSLGDTSSSFTITKYRKGFRPFNFHSWRPFINDPDYTFSIVGENVLNTLQSEIFANYNTNEKYKQVGASFIYGGLFPYITATVSGTFDREQPDTAFNITWNEFNAGIGLQLPLNLTSGRSYRNLNLSSGIYTRQVNYTGQAKNAFSNRQFNFVDLSLSYSQQSQMARQHIYPRFATTLSARYRTIITDYTANQFLTSNSFYLPGIVQNHNLVLQAAFQSRDTLQQYIFSNSFPFSRGYTNVNAPRMWKVGANYHFPLVYPDWGFGNIVYFLRIRANIFYDYSEIKSLRTGQRFQFRSSGAEIFFDTKWWNEYAVSLGIRYSYLHDASLLGLARNQWELVLPVNILGR